MSGISSKAAGSLTNRKKFNGKEEQRQEFSDGSGLDWLAYGMREYDSQIGRFFRVDPISDQYVYLTPYQYASNDPILNIDVDGLEGVSSNKLQLISKTTIAIDPGHGIDGSNNPSMDRGASGNGSNESDLALNISRSVNSNLASFGANTLMIRDGELTVTGNSLEYRTNTAKDGGAGVFVSIHINSSPNEEASGFTVLYKNGGDNKDKNKELAQSISDNQTTMDVSGSGITERNDLNVLNSFSSTGPAVLIEVGFVTNTSDAQKMNTQANQIGLDIAVGIYKYLSGGAPPTPPAFQEFDFFKNKKQ